MPQQVSGRFNPANTLLPSTTLRFKRAGLEGKADFFNSLDYRNIDPKDKWLENVARDAIGTVTGKIEDSTGIPTKTLAKIGWNKFKSKGKDFNDTSENARNQIFQIDNELNARQLDDNNHAGARQYRAKKKLIDDPNAYGITALGGANRSYATQGNLSKALGVVNVKPGQK